MKRFVLPLVIIIVAIIALFFTLDYVVTQGLKKTQFREFGKWNDSLKGRINADIIINGSSRAFIQISPKILEEKTECPTYNLGIDSNTFFSQNTLYKIYAKNNTKPKIVIQTIGDGTLYKPTKVYNQNQFLPYLDNPLVADFATDLEGIDSFDIKIPFYKYIGEETLISVGISEYFNLKKYENKSYKGFLSREKTWEEGGITELVRNSKRKSVKLDPKTAKNFEQYIKIATENEIKVVLVHTPEFEEFQPLSVNSLEIKSHFQKLADKYKIPLIDFSNHPISRNKDFFSDPVHLNSKGAEAFTEELAKKLIREYDLQACQ